MDGLAGKLPKVRQQPEHEGAYQVNRLDLEDRCLETFTANQGERHHQAVERKLREYCKLRQRAGYLGIESDLAVCCQ